MMIKERKKLTDTILAMLRSITLFLIFVIIVLMILPTYDEYNLYLRIGFLTLVIFFVLFDRARSFKRNIIKVFHISKGVKNIESLDNNKIRNLKKIMIILIGIEILLISAWISEIWNECDNYIRIGIVIIIGFCFFLDRWIVYLRKRTALKSDAKRGEEFDDEK